MQLVVINPYVNAKTFYTFYRSSKVPNRCNISWYERAHSNVRFLPKSLYKICYTERENVSLSEINVNDWVFPSPEREGICLQTRGQIRGCMNGVVILTTGSLHRPMEWSFYPLGHFVVRWSDRMRRRGTEVHTLPAELRHCPLSQLSLQPGPSFLH